MDQIGRVGVAGPIGAGRAPAGQGGFRLPDAPAAASAPAGVADVPGLLALQEAESDWPRDRPARRHAQAMLDELAALQRRALNGAVDPASLRRLAALARAMPASADPRLSDVLRAVSVRAAVELARHDP